MPTSANPEWAGSAYLYALSLIVGRSGRSGDLEKQAKDFLEALVAAYSPSRAALWLNDGDDGPANEHRHLLVSVPRSTGADRPPDTEASPLEDAEWVRAGIDDAGYPSLAAHCGVSGEAIAAYRLPGVGMLALGADDPQALQADELNALSAVVRLFAASLHDGLAMQALRGSVAQQQATLDSIPDLLYIKDTDGRYLGCNRAFSEFVGIRQQDVVGLSDEDVFPKDVADRNHALDAAILMGTSVSHTQEQRLGPEGQSVLLETLRSPYRDSDGHLLGVIGISRDLSGRPGLQDQLALSHYLVNQSHDPIYCIDPDDDFRMVYVNDAACQHFGKTREELLTMHVPDWDPDFTIERLKELRPRIETADGPVVFQTTHRVDDGRLVPMEISAKTVKYKGRTYHAGYARDLSAQQSAERKIRHLAFHDALTGLPNRRLFIDRLQQQNARLQRYGEQFALLLIDLDHFKEVNDTMGHVVGDRYLGAVAEHLRQNVRDSDTLARLGGDEFAVIMDHISSPDDAALLADKILESMREPFHVGEHVILGGTSIGIVHCDGGKDYDAESILSHADVALYETKNSGRGRFTFYETDMRERIERESVVARRLSMALRENGLTLVYQPQFDLATGTPCGLEALLRWSDAQLGDVSPSEFIPIAERRGLIEEIGAWVVASVIDQASQWYRQSIDFGHIAINISRMQLRNLQHMRDIADLVDGSGIPHTLLEMEITETGLSQANDEAVQVLERLHQSGVSLAIDDFGTGYSSLTSLRQFKTDRLKIDRDFVRDMLNDRDDAAIVQAIVALAASLQIDVVAEGVETEEQKAFLAGIGCRAAQGFLLARPLTVEQLAERIWPSPG